MRQKRIVKPYTAAEIADICNLYYNDEMTAAEIAEITGRTTSAIKQVVMKNRRDEKDAPPKENPVKIHENREQLTPREMIKALYDMGYRIENNQLICYQKQVVKLQDIINNG